NGWADPASSLEGTCEGHYRPSDHAAGADRGEAARGRRAARAPSPARRRGRSPDLRRRRGRLSFCGPEEDLAMKKTHRRQPREISTQPEAAPTPPLQAMGGKEERVSSVGRARVEAERSEREGEARFDLAPGPG